MPDRAFSRGMLLGAWLLAAATLASSLAGGPLFLGLAFTCFALAAIVPLIRHAREGFDAGEALIPFLAYFALTMGVRALALMTYEQSHVLPGFQDPRSPRFQELVAWCVFYSAVGLAALHAGYRSSIAIGWGNRMVAAAGRLASGASPGFPWAALAWVGVGLVGAALFVRGLGGVQGAVGDLSHAATEGALGSFWKLALMEFAVVGFHLALVRALVRPGGSPALWTLLLGVPLGACLFAVTSSKYLLLRMVLPAILCVHFLRKPIGFLRLAFVAIAFALLFPVFYAYRAGGTQALELVADPLAGELATWFEGGNMLTRGYNADSFIAVLERVDRDAPLRFGGTLSDLFVFFVPRDWWPEKPMSFSVEFGQQFLPGADYGGLTYFSPSLAGELFLNLHVIGIVLGFFALGALMRAGWLMARQGGPAGVLFYGYAYLTAIHLVEGSIAAKLEFLLMAVAPAWLALRLTMALAEPGRTASTPSHTHHGPALARHASAPAAFPRAS